MIAVMIRSIRFSPISASKFYSRGFTLPEVLRSRAQNAFGVATTGAAALFIGGLVADVPRIGSWVTVAIALARSGWYGQTVRPRRWLPAVGLLVLLAACGDSGGGDASDAEPDAAPAESATEATDAATDPGTAEEAPPTSTAAPAGGAPGVFNWTLVDEAPLYADDSHAFGAASNGEEVVGVGYRTGGGAEEISLAWRTRDGRTWERSELPQPAAAGIGGTNAYAAAAWSGGWVVVGVLKLDDPELAVWTSTDGETWAAVESPRSRRRRSGSAASRRLASRPPRTPSSSAAARRRSTTARRCGARRTAGRGSGWTTPTCA